MADFGHELLVRMLPGARDAACQHARFGVNCDRDQCFRESLRTVCYASNWFCHYDIAKARTAPCARQVGSRRRVPVPNVACARTERSGIHEIGARKLGFYRDGAFTIRLANKALAHLVLLSTPVKPKAASGLMAATCKA